jgi:response regulator of citrate/malate metabolism
MTRSWRTERWRTGAFDYLVKPFNLMRVSEIDADRTDSEEESK